MTEETVEAKLAKFGYINPTQSNYGGSYSAYQSYNEKGAETYSSANNNNYSPYSTYATFDVGTEATRSEATRSEATRTEATRTDVYKTYYLTELSKFILSHSKPANQPEIIDREGKIFIWRKQHQGWEEELTIHIQPSLVVNIYVNTINLVRTYNFIKDKKACLVAIDNAIKSF